jgi:ribosome-binding protein aMBF1 (putative translation factor)
MQALLQSNACRLCGHKLPEGDTFCDNVCEEEYHLKVCVICGKFAETGHTVKESSAHPEWAGRRVCKR